MEVRMKTFEPYPLLRNPHAQTLAATFLPRRFPRLPRSVPRDFETEPGTRIRGQCHWQAVPQERPTLVLLHGLEGSCESGYMLGLAERAFAAGWNAVRLNQRNCGGTESLTPTLYNSGLSGDYRAVLNELIERDTLARVFFAGYSMGGNLVLKMAGEFAGAAPPQLRGVAGVCPTIDLAECANALALPGNFIYEEHFVRNLKKRMLRKAALFPGKFDLGPLARVRSRIRRQNHREVLRLPRCRRLLLSVQRSARSGGDPRARVDCDREGRPFRPVREFLRSRRYEKHKHHCKRAGTRWPLRLRITVRRRRTLLGRSLRHGVFRKPAITHCDFRSFRRSELQAPRLARSGLPSAFNGCLNHSRSAGTAGNEF